MRPRALAIGWFLAWLVILIGPAACAPGGDAGSVDWTLERAPGDDDPHATGLLPTTPEEEAWLAAHAVRPQDIRPNQLALDRLRLDRCAQGLAPLPDAAVMVGWRSQLRSEELPPPLPAMVDNSLLPAFPPIRSQGSQGSCASFSTTYYLYTHMVALDRDWDAKSGGDDFRCSPKWVYNMVNGGEDAGSTIMAPFSALANHGCATWAQFPYNGNSNPANYRPWCLQTATWRSALRYRLDQIGSVNGLERTDGLQALKQLLTNGKVLVYTTYINSWQFLPGGLPDDPATSVDDPFVGQAVCYWMNGANGPHGMTVVGYHDGLWVDVNQNGVVDEGEKGAFKIANSWGTGWGNGGFAWVAYDALRTVSRVPGAPSASRMSVFNSAIWAAVRPGYQPLLTAEFDLTHLKRDQLMVTLGVGPVGATEPEQSWYPTALAYTGGPWAFDGGASAVPLIFAFDFTDLAEPDGQARRYFLGLRDRTAGDAGDLAEFKIVDALAGAEALSAQVPQTVDKVQAYAWIDYTFDSTNSPPTISAIVDQVIPVNGQAGPVAFTVGDVETPAADLSLRATVSVPSLVLVPDVIFGGSGANRTVTVHPQPYRTGSAQVTVFVSDGVAETSTSFGLHVTAGATSPPTVSPITDQVTPAGVATGPIAFSVGDAETPLDDLAISVQGMLLGWEVTGSGSARSLRVCPYPFDSGDHLITVIVSDGELSAQTTFQLTVQAPPENSPPTISPIADQVTDAGTPTAPIAFQIGDAQTDPAFLHVMVGSGNGKRINFVATFGGSGADRTVVLCPAGGEYGTELVTLRVWDGELEAQTQFQLTVNDTGNTAALIGPIPDQVIPLNGTSGPIPFSLSDAETPAEFFRLTFSCDNWNLIPWSGLTFGGQGENRTISVTPHRGESGSANVTVRVNDGALSTERSFGVYVDPNLLCGNGWLDPGESCDPPASCPAGCDDADACTADALSGSPQTCDAVCANVPILACGSGDGCCPAGCDAVADGDCAPICGNGAIEPGETCDPPASCPNGCDDGDACTADALSGSAASCTALCANDPILVCAGGDGCCPAGCNAVSDGDCAPICGNTVIEPGETCDPPASCSADCDDGDACTRDQTTGAASNCNLACSHASVSACVDGDGCCPAGCRGGTDSDCPIDCGNGQLDPGETCDPPASCPQACDDQDACTRDVLVGTVQTCTAACRFDPISQCADSDGCCPAGCTQVSDADCAAPAPGGRIEGGCGCGAGPASTGAWPVLALWLLGRRRRWALTR